MCTNTRSQGTFTSSHITIESVSSKRQVSGVSNPAKLSIDVTRKPLIKLVWYGFYVVLIGGLIATFHRLREARPDAVVAIGGGSVLDLAKAAALVPSADDLARWLGGERVEEPVGLPLIALPTTAGSGAEVSHAATALVGKHRLENDTTTGPPGRSTRS